MQNVKKRKICRYAFMETVLPIMMVLMLNPDKASNPWSHFHLLPYILHITSLLWNAMGNPSGKCPSNINNQVNQCGFSYRFSPLVFMVTAALRDLP